MSHRITDIINPLVEEAVNERAQSEDIYWDYSFVQTEQGLGIGLVLMRKGALLGSWVHSGNIILAANLLQQDEEQRENSMNSLVYEMVEGLNEAQSRQLRENGGETPEQPGVVAPASGEEGEGGERLLT